MSGDVHVQFCERLGVRFPRATLRALNRGVAAGIVTYPIVKRLSGRGKEVHRLIDLLAVVFIAKFIFLD